MAGPFGARGRDDSALCPFVRAGRVFDDGKAVGGVDFAFHALSRLSSFAGEKMGRNRRLSGAGYLDGAALFYSKCGNFGVAGLSLHTD